MAHEIRIPRLGWSMDTGTFVRWIKQDGDRVQQGDALFELESEKASQEIESLDDGILRVPPDGPAAGTELPVGTLIGYLLKPDEPLPWDEDRETAASRPGPSAGGVSPPDVVRSSPSARKRARELNVALEHVVGSGKRGRITRQDVERLARDARTPDSVSAEAAADIILPSPEARQGRIVATPRARRLAHELKVDWSRVEGTGKNGRIRERDIRMAASTAREPHPEVAPQTYTTTKRRRVIAQHMLTSHQTTAPVTLTTQADAANLQSTRDQFKATEQSSPVPSLNDIIMKLVANVLPRHLTLAAQWHGEHLVLPPPGAIHIGLAVDTPDGLLVPVIHDVARKTLVEIARTSSQLVELAQAGKLSIEQMQGGVFTITNLGRFGIDVFTPIINSPQSAILGIGAIRREPIVREDDQIAVGLRLTLNLTFDHRVVDGARAAQFLAEIRETIENPVPYLVGSQAT